MKRVACCATRTIAVRFVEIFTTRRNTGVWKWKSGCRLKHLTIKGDTLGAWRSLDERREELAAQRQKLLKRVDRLHERIGRLANREQHIINRITLRKTEPPDA